MKNLIKGMLITSLIVFSGCTSQKDAKKALESQGFSDIKYTGYSFFECSKEDTFHTGFEAKNSNGDIVKGTVCSGILKGATIRF